MSVGGEVLLEARNISKIFDSTVKALDRVTVEVREDEILAVVGENGAGKSTLMKILVGIHQPDEGELYHMGQKIPFPRNPLEALKRGISIVYQERGVIPHLKVYRFIFLGLEDRFTRLGRLQLNKIIGLAKSVFDELGIECDLGSYMNELPPPTQKMVEIARAILSIRLSVGDGESSKITPIIILDEPTAPLSIEERDELFKYLLELKKHNSFIFVSHIIPEVMRFSDRVYVLRDGKVAAFHDLKKQEITEDLLFKEIVGRESYYELLTRVEHRLVEPEKRKVVLSVRNLSKKGFYKDVSFDVHEGECVGLFGPTGCGKSEIAKTLYGEVVPDGGQITAENKPVNLKSGPHKRLKLHIGYFSGETGKELFLYWPIRKNVSIINFDKVSSKPLKLFRIINLKAEKNLAEKIVKTLNIKAPNVETECYSLSGGNKQKVSVGKWLERSPKLLILEDPTIGIDVGAREDIYEVLLDMKKKGISMVLVSDDPKEYALLCDKILMLREGVVQKVMTNQEFRGVMEL
ncbi:MAG: sugar ABC transporter ATP-binding protein [Candidatus Caldarchaeum sp.]|nr:sugar ABC transporter ATP-binding protein [Candidatus Caldarchaeum sp.]